MIAGAILFANFANAQSPELTIDPNGTTCSGDIEVRVYTHVIPGGTNPQVSDWFSIPSSDTRYDESDILSFSWGAGSGPGTYDQMTNDWQIYQIDVRNCNATPGSGTPTNCTSGNSDGVSMSNSNLVDCFVYSTACGTCGSGQEIDVASGFGQNASIVISDM